MTGSRATTVALLDVIFSHFSDKADDCDHVIGSLSSFEEWMNLEMYLALKHSGDAHVYARPSYKSCGVVNSKDFGDLLVATEREKTFFEVGLFHGETSRSKWIKKLARDREKLNDISQKNVNKIHIIVMGAKGRIHGDETWQKIIGLLPYSRNSENYSRSVFTKSGGELRFLAWINPSAERTATGHPATA
jgi:hypothetical protein